MERVITAKANYLVEQGHEVAIITTDTMGRKPFFPLHPSIQQIDLGVNYDCIDTSSRLKKYSALYRYKRRHKQLLTQRLRELRPDVVISPFSPRSRMGASRSQRAMARGGRPSQLTASPLPTIFVASSLGGQSAPLRVRQLDIRAPYC